MRKGMTYTDVGVDYEAMDSFKRMAQLAARETAGNLERFGFSEVEWSRGESVYLIETPWGYLALVVEGLGTKNLVADAMHKITGKSYYDHIAQCTMAAIVNDLITLGASPISVAMFLAAGDEKWFKDENKLNDLINRWGYVCQLARCIWGSGETQTLKNLVVHDSVVLGGSAVGIIIPKERLIRADIRDGDAIILFESSGIHTNGLTLAREIANKLPDGYKTRLSDGRMYGEALLDPTIIYVPVIEDCLNKGIRIHYAVHITGHGWRKLMRAKEPFVYIIEQIPEPQPVFSFIQEHGPVDDREAYGNLNMGAGFAVYVAQEDVDSVIFIAKQNGITALHAGHIEKRDLAKIVIIKPKQLEYPGTSLSVR